MMISVITPTHNRRHTLDRLWQSLCAQLGDVVFEWVLLDDGSTDGTKQWFDSLEKSQRLNARYIYQANQGKHVAINTGVNFAAGDWIFIVDSDDALTTDAVATVAIDVSQSEDSLNRGRVEATDQVISQKGAQTESCVGLSYRKAFFNGQLIGRKVETSTPLCLKPNVAGALFEGDLAYVFRKTAIAQHPFPVYPKEKFVPELFIWNRIADDGHIYFYPGKVLYLCEYLPDGYSSNFRHMLVCNPIGFACFYKDQLIRLRLGIPWLKAFIRYSQCKWYARLKQ